MVTESQSQAVLTARQEGLQTATEEQLRLFSEGKITSEQLTERKTKLESGYLKWYRNYLNQGITRQEQKEITKATHTQAVAETKAQSEYLLGEFAEGRITKLQLERSITGLGIRHTERYWKIQAGRQTGRFQYIQRFPEPPRISVEANLRDIPQPDVYEKMFRRVKIEPVRDVSPAGRLAADPYAYAQSLPVTRAPITYTGHTPFDTWKTDAIKLKTKVHTFLDDPTDIRILASHPLVKKYENILGSPSAGLREAAIKRRDDTAVIDLPDIRATENLWKRGMVGTTDIIAARSPRYSRGRAGPPRHGKEPIRKEDIDEALGLGAVFVAGAWDAFSTPVRPTLIGRSLQTTADLITSQEARGEAWKVIRRDPHGFGIGFAGGIAGGRLIGPVYRGATNLRGTLSRAKTTATEAYQILKYGRRDIDIPFEEFFVADELSDLWRVPEPVVEVSTFRGYRPMKVAIKDKAGYEYISIDADDIAAMRGGDLIGIADDTAAPPVRWKPEGGRLTIDIDQGISPTKIIEKTMRGDLDELAFYRTNYYDSLETPEIRNIKVKGLLKRPSKPWTPDTPELGTIKGGPLTSFTDELGNINRGGTIELVGTKVGPQASIWAETQTYYMRAPISPLRISPTIPKLVTTPGLGISGLGIGILTRLGTFALTRIDQAQLIEGRQRIRTEEITRALPGYLQIFKPVETQKGDTAQLTEPIEIFRPRDEEIQKFIPIFWPFNIQPLPIQTQVQRQRPRQRVIQIPGIAPPPTPFIPPPAWRGPQRGEPRKKRKLPFIPEEKKKKKGARDMSLWTGEFRRYGVDLKELRRLI